MRLRAVCEMDCDFVLIVRELGAHLGRLGVEQSGITV